MSVADVSSAILEGLRKAMPPLIPAEQIGFCSPADPGESYLLGLYLYSVTKDAKYQMASRGISMDSHTTQHPPLCVELGCMVTPYIGRKSTLLDDYRLLDRVLQIWHDRATIPFRSALQPQYVPEPRVELLSPDPDTVGKIWQFPGVAYRPSLFYRIAPVAVPSTVEAVTPRVREVDYHAEERERRT